MSKKIRFVASWITITQTLQQKTVTSSGRSGSGLGHLRVGSTFPSSSCPCLPCRLLCTWFDYTECWLICLFLLPCRFFYYVQDFNLGFRLTEKSSSAFFFIFNQVFGIFRKFDFFKHYTGSAISPLHLPCLHFWIFHLVCLTLLHTNYITSRFFWIFFGRTVSHLWGILGLSWMFLSKSTILALLRYVAQI